MVKHSINVLLTVGIVSNLHRAGEEAIHLERSIRVELEPFRLPGVLYSRTTTRLLSAVYGIMHWLSVLPSIDRYYSTKYNFILRNACTAWYLKLFVQNSQFYGKYCVDYQESFVHSSVIYERHSGYVRMCLYCVYCLAARLPLLTKSIDNRAVILISREIALALAHVEQIHWPMILKRCISGPRAEELDTYRGHQGSRSTRMRGVLLILVPPR